MDRKYPALLLLNNGYRVLYGDQIYQHLKPKQEVVTKQATQNNMEPEPLTFSLGRGGSGFGISSDQYSFLDLDADQMNTKGDGGLKQMHQSVRLDHVDQISTPPIEDTTKQGGGGGSRSSGNMTIEQYQQMRDNDIQTTQKRAM